MPNFLVELTDGRKFQVEADTPPTEADLQQYMGQLEAPKEEPMIDVSDTLKAAGQAIGGITTTAPHAFRQLYSGLDNPWQRSEGYKASQSAQDAYQQELEAANQAAVESGDISTLSRGMRQAGQSLGFSAGAMGASLAGGSAAGTAGRYIGGLAGPEGAIAGEAGGRVIGALGASYGAAYRMAGAQFLDDASKEIDAKFMEKLGRLPNKQEQDEAYAELKPLAEAFGHAEAGPEAIGNLAMAKAGKFILGLGIKNIKGLAAGALAKVGAGAGALATELGGETVTQVEQNRLEEQKNALLSGQAPPEQGSRTLGEYQTALGEVAPATLATMGLIGSVPTAYKAGELAVKAYKQPANAAAAELLHAASISSDDTELTNRATEEQIQASVNATVANGLGEQAAENDLTRYQPPNPQVANDFEEQLRANEDENLFGLGLEAEQDKLRQQQAYAEAQQRQAQFEGLSQNEPAITAPVGGAIPTVGQEETASIQPEQQLPDGLGILPAEQPQTAGQAPSEGVARNAEVIRQAAARMAGTEQGPNLNFPQVQPTVAEQPAERKYTVANVKTGKVVSRPDEPMTHKEAVTFRSKFSQPNNFTLVDVTNEQPISPQGAAPTGIATQTGQPMSGDSGKADVNIPQEGDAYDVLRFLNKGKNVPFITRKPKPNERYKQFNGPLDVASAKPQKVTSVTASNSQTIQPPITDSTMRTVVGITHDGEITSLDMGSERETGGLINISMPIELDGLGDKYRKFVVVDNSYAGRGQRDISVTEYTPKPTSPKQISPAAQKEPPLTPSGQVANEGGGPVTSNETEGGFQVQPPVETKETPQGEVSSADIESKALEILLQKRPNLSATVAAKAKKYFASRNSKDLEGISTGVKTAINHSLQEADPQELYAQLAKDRADEARARKMEEDDRRADEEMAKRQAELSSKRSTAWDSVVGTPTGVEMNAVSESDGQEALSVVHNSGDVPGVLNAFVGTSGQFLANPENEANFPDLWKILSAGRVDEGNFAYGRAFVFTDGIGVNASDRRNAERLGVTPSVAAVRRVLVHESLVHRGIYGLPSHLQKQILQWVAQNTTPDQLDNLARDYPQYEDWRSEPAQMLGICEEYLAKTVERLTKMPTDGPLARLMDILRDIWRWITRNTGEPTVQNLRDVVKLLKAGVVAADARLVNDGKVNIRFSTHSGSLVKRIREWINKDVDESILSLRFTSKEGELVRISDVVSDLGRISTDGHVKEYVQWLRENVAGLSQELNDVVSDMEWSLGINRPQIMASRPTFSTPLSAQLANAAGRMRQMRENQSPRPETETNISLQQIRNEIRAAYDRAIVGEGSVQTSLQKVFDGVKTAIPELSEKQFGEQVQALYEDGSAFLVPADRSDTMIAAGEKWGVYDASGMPASYVGVMPSEVKASRVSGDVINKQRTDYQKNKVTGKSVEYQGHAPINSQGEVIDPIWRTEEQYAPKERMADKFVNEVADSLDDLTELPEQIRNDTYLREIGAEYDGDFQTLLQAQTARFLRQKADAATDPEEKQKLQDASDKATAFLRQSATRAGVNLNMIKQIQKDARFAGMFALDMVKTAKKEDQAAVVGPNFSQAAAGAVEDLSDKSNTEASASIESDLNAQKEESEIEAGEALLNPRQRTIWERMKDILRLRARIAKAKLLKVANIKASNAAESQADVARFVQMSDKELADLDTKLSKEFDSLSNEFFGREKPKKGIRKKTGEEKPINPVIARMVSIVATKLGGGTNLEAALEALMPESPSYKDKIVDDIVSGIVGRVNQSIKKPQKAGALAALTKQLKTILTGNIKVDKAKLPDESLGQKALRAFGYVTSNEEMVNRAWDESRVKVRENLAEMDETATARQIEDRLNALMGVIPTQLYSTPQARSVIREALEDTKFDNSKTILENAAEAKAEVLSKLQEAVSKEGAVDPARWQRDQSYIIHAFDAMIADLQAAKDKVTQKTKEKLLKGGKMTELQRLLDKTREGWQWKEIFSMPKAGQIRRRADMLAKVKENEAFKNLTGAEQAQLVDLLDQAWIDRKAAYLGQKLKASPIIRLPWITTQGAAKKLESATSDLLKAFNDGTFNRDIFNAILAQKYGVKLIDQAAMAKAEKLAEELQDPELPDPVYAKKADELLKLIANTQDLNTAKMLNDFWVTSVLAGPRTWFDIGFAALNGLQRLIVDSTALALHGDFKTAGTALSRFVGIMPQAFKEAAHFIKTGDVSLLVNSKDQFSRFLAKGLKGGQHTSTSYQLSHWDQDKAPGAPAWKKAQGNILRGIGRFMQVVERLLTALDHINATATKYGYLPISIAQNQKKYAQARLPNAKEMERFRTQAKAYLLDGKEPSNHGEQVTLDAWTRHFTDKFYSDWQDVIDGASYAGAVSSGVLDPEGIVGGIYNAILGGASRATTAADALKVKADAMVNDPNITRIDAYTQKGLATLGQLVAYSVRNLLGFRFIRFGAVKFNDSLTYIPAIGLLRLAESDNKHATKRAMILNNQAFGIILAAVGYAMIKAVADDDDPEKRGFDITGSLDGLTAAEKKQLSDSGQKEYTLTIYINGKPLRLVYKTWPISAALSAIGTLTDMVQFKRAKWDQKEFTDRMIAAVVVATTSTLDSASMSQFAELVGKGQYASDPDEAFVNKITRVGTNFAGGFIPRIFKDLDYWLLDPNARKYDTVWQNLGKEVPIWRTRIGAPKLDIFAQPVQTPRSPWSRAIVQQPDDEAYNTLGLLNSRDLWLTPGNPELRTVGTKNRRRGLTDEEQTRYIKLVGEGYKQVVEKYGQKILAMPKERAKSFLADKTKDVRDLAEKKAVRRLTSS